METDLKLSLPVLCSMNLCQSYVISYMCKDLYKLYINYQCTAV